MTRPWRYLSLLAVPVFTAGCYEMSNLKGEFDALQAQHATLRADFDLIVSQLEGWADDIDGWGEEAGDAICDIVSANPPNTKYAQETRDFCGSGDPPPQHPPDPPEWGED